jgi:hypothetical protein
MNVYVPYTVQIVCTTLRISIYKPIPGQKLFISHGCSYSSDKWMDVLHIG